MDKEIIKKMATFGGSLKVNKGNLWMYGQGSGTSKRRLFGMKGPLHPGMPNKEEVTLDALHSDTKQTLIRELADQTHLTRVEAETVVESLLKAGVLEEVNDPTLGKVLVFRGR